MMIILAQKKEKILSACKDFQSEGVKIIIGPVDSKFVNDLKEFDDLVFLSLSNMNSIFEKNVIMMGINLESQLLAIKKFIEKQEKNKTVINLFFPYRDFFVFVYILFIIFIKFIFK